MMSESDNFCLVISIKLTTIRLSENKIVEPELECLMIFRKIYDSLCIRHKQNISIYINNTYL